MCSKCETAAFNFHTAENATMICVYLECKETGIQKTRGKKKNPKHYYHVNSVTQPGWDTGIGRYTHTRTHGTEGKAAETKPSIPIWWVTQVHACTHAHPKPCALGSLQSKASEICLNSSKNARERKGGQVLKTSCGAMEWGLPHWVLRSMWSSQDWRQTSWNTHDGVW